MPAEHSCASYGSPVPAPRWRRTPSTRLLADPTVGHVVSTMDCMKTLVVFSHLRWNFVYQRPQHLLSRLAAAMAGDLHRGTHAEARPDRIEHIAAAPGVEVWRPHLRGAAHGFHPDHKAVLQRLVAQGPRRAAASTTTGSGSTRRWRCPWRDKLEPEGIIYDCMDELSAVPRRAAANCSTRRAALFKAADVVFTGGRSLYDAKKHRHPNVHCFPSSVDALHFRQGTRETIRCSRRIAASAPGLLRRDRRAHRPRADRRHRRRAARLADRDGRARS